MGINQTDEEDVMTCGKGIAQHAAIPRELGVMFQALAETLALHREMLLLHDPNARREDEVYAGLAASWQQIAALLQEAAGRMEAQRELPMAAHDEQAWSDRHLRAFEKFVASQSRLLELVRAAAPRDEHMLASMKAPAAEPAPTPHTPSRR